MQMQVETFIVMNRNRVEDEVSEVNRKIELSFSLMPERRERGRARGMQYFSPANPQAPLTFLLSLSQRNK